MSGELKRNGTFTLALGVLVVVAAAGCESPVATATGFHDGLSAPLFTRGQPGKPLPFRADVTFTGELIAPDAPGSAARCNELELFTLRGSGQGVVTYMGYTTGTFSNCTAFPIPGPVDVLDGEVTMIAANGDLLFLTYSGVQHEVDLATFTAEYAATYLIVGGSGRFEGASGMLEATGVVDFNTGGLSTEVAEGWISFDASDRRP